MAGAGGGPAGRRTTAPASQDATVRRVVDGDTVELSDGRLVRYIGIDTPESRRRQGGRWIEDPQPFASEATAANRRLVQGRRVRLEYDAQRLDRHGRTLAYVYVGGVCVNEQLLRDGYAQPLTIPPNVAHAAAFQAAAAEARRAGRGLWQATGRGRGPPAIPGAGGTSESGGR